jgi:hypothetical protein
VGILVKPMSNQCQDQVYRSPIKPMSNLRNNWTRHVKVCGFKALSLMCEMLGAAHWSRDVEDWKTDCGQSMPVCLVVSTPPRPLPQRSGIAKQTTPSGFSALKTMSETRQAKRPRLDEPAASTSELPTSDEVSVRLAKMSNSDAKALLLQIVMKTKQHVVNSTSLLSLGTPLEEWWRIQK